jgi:pilus assembly protein Flp/PilA
MRNLLTRFAKNEEGAALVEYGLLVGLIAVVCITAVTNLGLYVEGAFDAINTALAAAGIAKA